MCYAIFQCCFYLYIWKSDTTASAAKRFVEGGDFADIANALQMLVIPKLQSFRGIIQSSPQIKGSEKHNSLQYLPAWQLDDACGYLKAISDTTCLRTFQTLRSCRLSRSIHFGHVWATDYYWRACRGMKKAKHHHDTGGIWRVHVWVLKELQRISYP